MSYYVEWASCPTSHNPTRLTEVNGPLSALIKSGDSIKWKTQMRLALGTNEHVIFKVWTEADGERQVVYKDGGYGKNYISPNIDALLGAELKEVRV